MKNILIAITFALLFQSCKDKTVDNSTIEPIRALKLTSNKQSGKAPIDIIFTGIFNGVTDTSKTFYPEYFLWGENSKTLILYRLSDTTIKAKKYYTDTLTFSATGSHNIFMVLQTSYGPTYSDTLKIVIE